MSREKSKNNFYSSIEEELIDLKNSGQLRTLPKTDTTSNRLNLSSNDYLGLAGLKEEFQNKHLNSSPFGSTSSRLLTGNHEAYEKLEKFIGETYSQITGNEVVSLIFNSGYHANTGIPAVITGKEDLILSDKLNHASIIDGALLSRATTIRYPHNNYGKLHSILTNRRKDFKRVVIISESIFSMDGDCADLKRLVDIKKEFDCLLYIDEAHACGVSGKKGLGVCESSDTAKDIDIILGTFGKSYASLGAYVVVKKSLRDLLINRCRSLIFTTALPAGIVEWSGISFKESLMMEGRRRHLNALSQKLREKLKNMKIKTGGSSHIIPIYTGNNQNSILLAEYLNKKGFLVFPIRPPTVPPDSCRIRISLSAKFGWHDIKDIPELISQRREFL